MRSEPGSTEFTELLQALRPLSLGHGRIHLLRVEVWTTGSAIAS